MPTYEYACKSCGEHLEVVQSFKDDSLTTCPACGGSLRKVFGSIGIAFKGSGFYRTDSRGGAPRHEKDKDKDKDATKPAASSGDKDKASGTSTSSEPAKPAASSSGSSTSAGSPDSKTKAAPQASASAG